MLKLLICSVILRLGVGLAFSLSPDSTPPPVYNRFSNISLGNPKAELEEVNPSWMAENECGGDEFGNVWCPGSTVSPIIIGTDPPPSEVRMDSGAGDKDNSAESENEEEGKIESETNASNDTETEVGHDGENIENESSTTMTTDPTDA